MKKILIQIIKLSICFGIGILINLAVLVPDGTTSVIPNRGTLNTLLAGGGTTDDFESYVVADGLAQHDLSVPSLNNTTLVNGQGPGLVHAGATYVFTGGYIQWNGNNYFGLQTKTILALAQVLEIDYTSPVKAMGIDLEEFSGNPDGTGTPFTDSVTAQVYGPGGLIYTSPPINLSGPTAVFFGFEDSGGIVRVVFTGSTNIWSPIIDNHTYGGAPTPTSVPTMTEWGLILFMILAGSGSIFYLRRQKQSK
jgi:hypothetical protein